MRRGRTGETPFAMFLKNLVRPIIKGFYYLIKGIRTHKFVTILLILLLLASGSIATKLTTQEWPFGIGSDPFADFNTHGYGSGEQVKNWLYALRDGDVSTLQALQQYLFAQGPDPTQLVGQYSQTVAHTNWRSINVMGIFPEADGSVDSFIEIDYTTNGPGGVTKQMMVWNFTTLPTREGQIIYIHLVDARAPLPSYLGG
jgi:hypothetical protein